MGSDEKEPVIHEERFVEVSRTKKDLILIVNIYFMIKKH